MNINTVYVRAAMAAAMLGGFIAVHAPAVLAAPDRSGMSIQARAPLQATLLPTVTVVANAAHAADAGFHVAAGSALPVTLLPTVYVTASASSFGMTQAIDTLDARIASR